MHNGWQNRSLKIISCNRVKLQTDIIVIRNSLLLRHPSPVIYYFFPLLHVYVYITCIRRTFSFCRRRVFANVSDTKRFAVVDLFELYNRISSFSAKRKFPRSRFVPAVWIRYMHTYTRIQVTCIYMCVHLSRFVSIQLRWTRIENGKYRLHKRRGPQ